MAERAIELLDTNGDSAIDSDEVIAAPGLAVSLKLIDTNRDGNLSYEEIRKRIALHEDMGTGICGDSYTVLLNGRPLSHARIKFEPEAFLNDAIEPASGITDENGYVFPQTEGQSIQGIRAGFYRLKVYPDGSADDEPLSLNEEIGLEVKAFSDDGDALPVIRLRK